MDIIVGADTGVIKGITLNPEHVTNHTPSTLAALDPRRDAVTCMCWSDDGAQVNVLSANLDRKLQLFNTTAPTKVVEMFTIDGGGGRIVGLFMNDYKIVSASESGTVNVHNVDGTQLHSFECGVNVRRMRVNPNDKSTIVTVGQENLLKTWDLNRCEQNEFQPTFTCKNLPHDWLQLRVPVCDNDVRFIVDSPLIVSCTADHELRLYDPRAQRRPVNRINYGEYPFTCLDTPNHDGNGAHRVIAGTTQGHMALYDWRGKVGLAHVFKSFAGSVRAIECHPSAPLVASCSLDRFTRVHHVDDKTTLNKIYCKTRLNCLLLRTNMSTTPLDDGVKELTVDEDNNAKLIDDAVDGSDGENVWANMIVTGKPNVKRRLVDAPRRYMRH